MTHYWWCGICGSVAVYRRGDPCMRCVGEMSALISPIVRPPLPPPPPPLLRFLRWLTATRHREA